MTQTPSNNDLYDVYAFVHPLHLQVIYVGITNNLERRLKQHFAKQPWLASMRAKRFEPIIIKLEPERIHGRTRALLYEAYWIGKLATWHPLENIAGNIHQPNPVKKLILDSSEKDFFRLPEVEQYRILALNSEGVRRFGFQYMNAFCVLWQEGIRGGTAPLDTRKHWYEVAEIAFRWASIPTIEDEDEGMCLDNEMIRRLMIEEGLDTDEAMGTLAELKQVEDEEMEVQL